MSNFIPSNDHFFKRARNIRNELLNRTYKYILPGRVAQWSAHPLRCPRSWVRTRPHPRRTKRAFALCQFGGLNEAKTFINIYYLIIL